MYLPKSFEVTDPIKLAEVMNRFSFATLITTTGGVPFATHLPVLHRPRPGTTGILVGHVARANPQWQHFANQTESLAIFSGPHAYVSPSWYEADLAVPTWNYIAVHAYGVPRVIEDEAWLETLLDEMVQRYESNRSQPWPNQLPEDFRATFEKHRRVRDADHTHRRQVQAQPKPARTGSSQRRLRVERFGESRRCRSR